jgi:hypothetical protein
VLPTFAFSLQQRRNGEDCEAAATNAAAEADVVAADAIGVQVAAAAGEQPKMQ